MSGPAPAIIFTVGHSNHPFPALLALLRTAGIDFVADVRSAPVSRRCPWFDKPPLTAALAEAGIDYLFLGRELGGKPYDPALRDAHGNPDYPAIARSEAFRHGLARVEALARGHRLALMCAEADPLRCHRHHLIAPALETRGVTVVHLLSDGRRETYLEAERRRTGGQGDLFR